ncbi:MAG: vitamin K epoxide reductase family protein [Candidatus Liptonbacteria bacterium]|nr:vitamin K epoxide reductase family protein [Candidatus Liptonbacteria bacterium]
MRFLTLAVLAGVGFLDSLYLTVSHYRNVSPVCGPLVGCETVLSSPYATLIGGTPNALWGVLYYLVLIALGVELYRSKDDVLLLAAKIIAVLGVAAHLYFIYLQAFVIRAWCPYCLLSASLTATIVLLLFLPRREQTL